MTENINVVKQETPQQTEKKLCSLYKVSGIKGKSQCKLKFINTIELEEGQYTPDDKIKEVDIFTRVNAEFFECNVTNTFLTTTKKIPMRYMSVLLNKPLRRVLLFRVYIYFTITDDIVSAHQLKNEKLNGHYSMELYIDNQLTKLEDLDIYTTDDEIYDRLIKFATSDETKDFIKTVVADVNKIFAEQYAEDLEYFKKPTKILSLKDYVLD